MKKKEKSSIQNAGTAELAKIVREGEDKLLGLTVARYTKPAKNVREMRMIRQKIAVAKTVLRTKELQHE